jgi:hypothetical protein
MNTAWLLKRNTASKIHYGNLINLAAMFCNFKIHSSGLSEGHDYIAFYKTDSTTEVMVVCMINEHNCEKWGVSLDIIEQAKEANMPLLMVEAEVVDKLV